LDPEDDKEDYSFSFLKMGFVSWKKHVWDQRENAIEKLIQILANETTKEILNKILESISN